MDFEKTNLEKLRFSCQVRGPDITQKFWIIIPSPEGEG